MGTNRHRFSARTQDRLNRSGLHTLGEGVRRGLQHGEECQQVVTAAAFAVIACTGRASVRLETQRLGPAWWAACAAAGVNPDHYRFWVHEGPEATAGSTVAETEGGVEPRRSSSPFLKTPPPGAADAGAEPPGRSCAAVFHEAERGPVWFGGRSRTPPRRASSAGRRRGYPSRTVRPRRCWALGADQLAGQGFLKGHSCLVPTATSPAGGGSGRLGVGRCRGVRAH